MTVDIKSLLLAAAVFAEVMSDSIMVSLKIMTKQGKIEALKKNK